MSGQALLVVAAVGALCLAAGLLLRPGRRDAELASLRDSVRRTEGRIQSFADLLERRWQATDEAADRQTSEMNRTLAGIRERIGEIREAHRGIEKLDTHIVDLQKLLANKQAAGAFGEVQLENLVRQALPPRAYAFQRTLSNRNRVDCLVLLPHPPGPIAIDSKFPVASFRAFLEARGGDRERAARRNLETAVKKHVSDIRDRYIVPGETSDWAVMFLPSESLFAELHASFPEVIEYAFGARIGIASPSTAMALLNTIRSVLRDADFQTHAGWIQVELGHLMQDLGRLDDRMNGLQRHFAQIVDDVRAVEISTRKILSRAGRIRDVEIGGETPGSRGEAPPPEAGASREAWGSRPPAGSAPDAGHTRGPRMDRADGPSRKRPG